jgi:CheY-like chemotaxis protein
MTVIVSSFSMPELNGDAFARIVKADFPDTPVLLMVSGATECDALSAMPSFPSLFFPPSL